MLIEEVDSHQDDVDCPLDTLLWEEDNLQDDWGYPACMYARVCMCVMYGSELHECEGVRL